jgi:hypothetical protein
VAEFPCAGAGADRALVDHAADRAPAGALECGEFSIF